MCSFPSLLEELLACCGYNERTVCVPFLQIENSSAIVVKIEPSLVIKSVRKSRVEFGCTVTLGFPGFWVGRLILLSSGYIFLSGIRVQVRIYH